MEADPTDDVLGPKKRNYDFLQLVRDKNYPDALLLGKLILKDSPNNPSVRKFVEFIEKNAVKLDEMVKEEEEYESAHSSDDSEEEEEEVQGEAQTNGDAKSSSSSDKDEKEEQEEELEEQKPEPKVELSTCTLNPFPHVCPRHHRLIIEAAKKGELDKQKNGSK